MFLGLVVYIFKWVCLSSSILSGVLVLLAFSNVVLSVWCPDKGSDSTSPPSSLSSVSLLHSALAKILVPPLLILCLVLLNSILPPKWF